MPGDLLLDTSIVIALFRRDVAVERRVSESVSLHISPIVVGELIYGARKSGRRDVNLDRARDFIRSIHVFKCSPETGLVYGDLKNRLREAGKPIPDNDLWIAATAVEHGLPLVTRDGHFEHVPGLAVEHW